MIGNPGCPLPWGHGGGYRQGLKENAEIRSISSRNAGNTTFGVFGGTCYNYHLTVDTEHVECGPNLATPGTASVTEKQKMFF